MLKTLRFDRKRRRLLQRAGAAAANRDARASAHHRAHDRADPHASMSTSWGGSYTAAQDAAFFKPFTAATGIQVRTVTPVSYGKIKAQVQTRRYEFDMTSINSMQWLRAVREGLAEPIDWSVVNRDALPPNAVVADGIGIAQNILGTALCYRTDKYPGAAEIVGRFLGREEISGQPQPLPERLAAHADLCAVGRWRAARSALSARHRSRLQEARSDQAAHQSLVARRARSRNSLSATARST